MCGVYVLEKILLNKHNHCRHESASKIQKARKFKQVYRVHLHCFCWVGDPAVASKLGEVAKDLDRLTVEANSGRWK